jgi:hypothetical protein
MPADLTDAIERLRGLEKLLPSELDKLTTILRTYPVMLDLIEAQVAPIYAKWNAEVAPIYAKWEAEVAEAFIRLAGLNTP